MRRTLGWGRTEVTLSKFIIVIGANDEQLSWSDCFGRQVKNLIFVKLKFLVDNKLFWTAILKTFIHLNGYKFYIESNLNDISIHNIFDCLRQLRFKIFEDAKAYHLSV